MKCLARDHLLSLVLLTFVGGVCLAEGPTVSNRYALLIGVSNYPADRFSELPGAEPDVRDLSLVLMNRGYTQKNVILMTHRTGASDPRRLPTASRVRKQLRKLSRIDDPNAMVLVALAGHGVQPSGKEYYFCPQNADLKRPETLVSIREIYQALEGCSAGSKLLLVDACREATANASSVGSGIHSVTRLANLSGNALPDPPPGTAAFFSCNAGELAYERHGDGETNGVFFRAVIRGLEGAAAGSEATIALSDLERFVKKDVQAFVRKTYSAEQNPVLRNNSFGTIPLVKYSPGQKQLAEVYELRIRGRRQEARVIVDRLLADDPENAGALAARAQMVTEKAEGSEDVEQLAEAETLAKRAVQIAPDMASTHVAMAEVQRALGKLPAAVQSCNRALQCDPNCALAFAYRAAIQLQRKRRETVMTDVERAMELDKNDPVVKTIYAAALFAENRMDEGFAVLERGLETTPDVPVLHFMKGYGLDQQGRYDKAILAFTAGIRLDADDIHLLVRRGASLAKVGDFIGALEDAAAAERISPNNADVTAIRVLVYTSKKDYSAALAALQNALLRDPNRREFYQMRAQILTALGRTSEASRDRQKLAQLTAIN